jgi:hypothetical protein
MTKLPMTYYEIFGLERCSEYLWDTVDRGYVLQNLSQIRWCKKNGIGNAPILFIIEEFFITGALADHPQPETVIGYVHLECDEETAMLFKLKWL